MNVHFYKKMVSQYSPEIFPVEITVYQVLIRLILLGQQYVYNFLTFLLLYPPT